jgi:K(+)-stimulated pyrophosphate-energized sodium pump
VADNAQSIYELSLIEKEKNIVKDIKDNYGFTPDFKKGKRNLEANDGAGNTFKATAKPVLIGTAVVGATTMIFSIIMLLTNGLTVHMENLTILNAPFLFGLIAGGAVVYWFSGATIHAVTSGAYKAVQFIKKTINLKSAKRASMEDSIKVVGICTDYAQKGMINLFMAIFLGIIAFACVDSYFFIGYLIAIAIVGLFQAIYMANTGGAWDNTKKVVEVDLNEKGTPLHEAAVIGDTIGDPFKDTTSVSLNPVIKFSTLFGLLAMELTLAMSSKARIIVAIICFAATLFFVQRSFSSLLIKEEKVKAGKK